MWTSKQIMRMTNHLLNTMGIDESARTEIRRRLFLPYNKMSTNKWGRINRTGKSSFDNHKHTTPTIARGKTINGGYRWWVVKVAVIMAYLHNPKVPSHPLIRVTTQRETVTSHSQDLVKTSLQSGQSELHQWWGKSTSWAPWRNTDRRARHHCCEISSKMM